MAGFTATSFTMSLPGEASIHQVSSFPYRRQFWERIDDYRAVLEDYSRRLLPVVDWEPTDNGNVRVQNDTGDLYRFFDATPQTEFLYGCVQHTVERNLPEESAFLRRYDWFRAELSLMVDMPERLCDLLFRFLHNNGGKLSRRGRKREFAELNDEEVTRIEAIYREVSWTQMSEPDRTSTTPKEVAAAPGAGFRRRIQRRQRWSSAEAVRRCLRNYRRHRHAWLHPGCPGDRQSDGIALRVVYPPDQAVDCTRNCIALPGYDIPKSHVRRRLARSRAQLPAAIARSDLAASTAARTRTNPVSRSRFCDSIVRCALDCGMQAVPGSRGCRQMMSTPPPWIHRSPFERECVQKWIDGLCPDEKRPCIGWPLTYLRFLNRVFAAWSERTRAGGTRPDSSA